jgi:hypothetical protein
MNKLSDMESLRQLCALLARETATDPAGWTIERGSQVNGRRWRIVGPAVITGATAAELFNAAIEWFDGYRFAVRSAALRIQQ